MKESPVPSRRAAIAVLVFALGFATLTATAAAASDPTPPPPPSWASELAPYLQPGAAFPTAEPMTDLQFHQWSWEAFAWATTPDANGLPHFMNLHTSADLLGGTKANAPEHPHLLQLALRSPLKHGAKDYVEGAGAIVEADGNMLVAQNGYPVYASVHFNSSYLKTARNNLLITGAFDANTPGDDYFSVGAAVFKATWLALNPATQSWPAGTFGTPPPLGAFVTQAQVPVLTSEIIDGFTVVHPVIPQQLVTINVALVGLHVVGFATNHPEFLWGTFEHTLNAPMVPDNTFGPTLPLPTVPPPGAPAGTSYTFYQTGTPYFVKNALGDEVLNVNLQNQNPGTVPVLDATTQTLSPVTNVVQENATGGESPAGQANIASLNTASAPIFAAQTNPTQALFANYRLIGTVWLAPNTYDNALQASNAVAANAIGSLNLANSTAETFQQVATNAVPANNQNCFTCHNATSYSFQTPAHAVRRVAISHVLSQGLPQYGVPNQIPAVPLISGLK